MLISGVCGTAICVNKIMHLHLLIKQLVKAFFVHYVFKAELAITAAKFSYQLMIVIKC